MRRRELLTLLCGGGAGIFGLQIEASAQTPTTARRVAFVVSTGPVNQREHEFFRAFVDELRNLGYVEGRHLTLEGYSGEGRFDRLAELARSIVETGPEVIVAATDPVARAFNEATATIPLVVACSDPVALGFAQSMARPGGNITGIAVYAGPVILEKYVEIIREIDPRILRIGVLAQKLSWEKHHGSWLSRRLLWSPRLRRAAGSGRRRCCCRRSCSSGQLLRLRISRLQLSSLRISCLRSLRPGMLDQMFA